MAVEALNWNHPRVLFASEVVREAASLALRINAARAGLAISKEDRSPVTVADYSVQALVAHRLSERFPGESLVAEEDAGLLSDEPRLLEAVAHWIEPLVGAGADPRALIDQGSGKADSSFWTLDPIDGTKGFLRGEQYAVALAYLQRGQVLLGVLGCPNLAPTGVAEGGGKGSLMVAVRGQGCRAQVLEDRDSFIRLNVSAVIEIQSARVLRSIESAHTNLSQMDQLIGTLGIRSPAVGLDSQAKYGALAGGQGDLMLRLLSPDRPGYHEKIWDQAAGSLVVQEAGGRVTDLRGQPLDFSCGRRLERNQGVLASNGLLHDRVLEALEELGLETESA